MVLIAIYFVFHDKIIVCSVKSLLTFSVREVESLCVVYQYVLGWTFNFINFATLIYSLFNKINKPCLMRYYFIPIVLIERFLPMFAPDVEPKIGFPINHLIISRLILLTCFNSPQILPNSTWTTSHTQVKEIRYDNQNDSMDFISLISIGYDYKNTDANANWQD